MVRRITDARKGAAGSSASTRSSRATAGEEGVVPCAWTWSSSSPFPPARRHDAPTRRVSSPRAGRSTSSTSSWLRTGPTSPVPLLLTRDRGSRPGRGATLLADSGALDRRLPRRRPRRRLLYLREGPISPPVEGSTTRTGLFISMAVTSSSSTTSTADRGNMHWPRRRLRPPVHWTELGRGLTPLPAGRLVLEAAVAWTRTRRRSARRRSPSPRPRARRGACALSTATTAGGPGRNSRRTPLVGDEGRDRCSGHAHEAMGMLSTTRRAAGATSRSTRRPT